MLSRDGEVGFSVRKLGVSIGVDPMTVLHHFGSKDELLRRIADRALATVELPLPSADWRADLRNVAAVLPGSRPPSPTRVSSALPLSRNGSRRPCFERGGLPRAAELPGFRTPRPPDLGLRSTRSFSVTPWPRPKGCCDRSARRTQRSCAPWTRCLFRDAGADPGLQGARSRGDVRSSRSTPSSTGCRAGARPARSADQAARNKATQPSLSISTSSKRCLKPSDKESRSSSRLLNTPFAL